MDASDADLIQQCLHGDNAGFDLLVGRHQKQVYRFCFGMLGNAEDASDAAQESFIKAYHALGDFRKDASFVSWMLRIANNACVDLWRRRTRRQAASVDDEESGLADIPSSDPDPETALLGGESRRLVRDAIGRLPEKHRGALVMFYVNGMSIKDMSRALGRPEGTVKSDLHAAREMLRRKLEGVVVEA